MDDFTAALGYERRLREEAYLDSPVYIQGEPCKQITPRLLAALFRIESPFLNGSREVEQADILHFLWTCHARNPMRAPARKSIWKPSTWRKSERRKFLDRINKGFDFVAAEYEIDAFIAATLMDAPEGKNGLPYVCSVAALEYSMCGEPFRWEREYLLDTPLRIIYQLLRCRAQDHGVTLKNKFSDPILQSALSELNTPEEMAKRAEEFRRKFQGDN